MDQFKILLKNEKIRFYKRFSLFIIITGTALYLYNTFFSGINSHWVHKFAVPVSMALALSIRFFFGNIGPTRIHSAFYIILASGWIFHGQYWIALITLILFFFFLASMEKKILLVGSKKIIFPSFPKKIIHWPELKNMIIKDGILTIDFETNKIIQQYLEDSDTVPVDEFNEFCKKELNNHSK